MGKKEKELTAEEKERVNKEEAEEEGKASEVDTVRLVEISEGE